MIHLSLRAFFLNLSLYHFACADNKCLFIILSNVKDCWGRHHLDINHPQTKQELSKHRKAGVSILQL